MIAHRGYSAKYPENTLKSIRAALDSNRAQGIEIDLHLTADGQVILQHDQDLDRMTVGGTGNVIDRPWHGYIDSLCTKEEIKSGNEQCEPVALLSQVLECLPEGFTVVLDVKDDQPLEVLDKISEILSAYHQKRLVIYLGVWREDFAHHARKLFHESAVMITLIAEVCTTNNLKSPLYDAFNLDVTQIQPEVVQEAAQLKKPLLLWTCNSAGDIAKAKSLNIQGILTDDPFLV